MKSDFCQSSPALSSWALKFKCVLESPGELLKLTVSELYLFKTGPLSLSRSGLGLKNLHFKKPPRDEMLLVSGSITFLAILT